MLNSVHLQDAFGYSSPLQSHWILLGCSSKCVSLSHCHLLLSLSAAALAKPSLSVSQRTVTEQREGTVFSCDTEVDNVTIHWVSNNSPLTLNERMKLSADHKTLTILIVDRQDSGSYQCEVRCGFEARRSNISLLSVNCESSGFPSPLLVLTSLAFSLVL